MPTHPKRCSFCIDDMPRQAEQHDGGLGSKLEVKKHVSFLLRCLRLLPQPYTSADDQRMTLGYFAISGLDLLKASDKIATEERAELIEWVYEQQAPQGGFRGGPSSPFAAGPSGLTSSRGLGGAGGGNVAMTYAALLILAVLQDDFTRLDRVALLRFVGGLQDRAGEGGFAAEGGADELVDRDPRFTYCAAAICSMLGEWGKVDVGRARNYLEGCQRYDGGFGASQMHESHSGMTYCCIAALRLLPAPAHTKSDSPGWVTWAREQEALSWLAHRQVAPSLPEPPEGGRSTTNKRDGSDEEGDRDSEDDDDQDELAGGFQGRPSKLPPDVCYSFWNGAALSLLSQHDLIDASADASYVLSAQSRVGGIAKIPDEHPDLLHSYLGLASLSLHQSVAGERGGQIEFGMKRLDAAYNCSMEAKAWIRQHLTK